MRKTKYGPEPTPSFRGIEFVEWAISTGRAKKVESGCIEWQMALRLDGYANISIHDKSFAAHRIAASSSKEDIVSHLCHNRKCVNPDHLKNGTHKENKALDIGRFFRKGGTCEYVGCSRACSTIRLCPLHYRMKKFGISEEESMKMNREMSNAYRERKKLKKTNLTNLTKESN